MEIKDKIENQQCRACYNSKKGLRYLTTLTKCTGHQQQKSYAELFKEVSNINIIDDLYGDLLPQLICEGCARRLKTAHAFIQQTHEVNERLMSIVGKLEGKKEPPVDILLIGDIKSEKEEDADDMGLFEPECFIELKEETPHKLVAEGTSEDTLNMKKEEESITKITTSETVDTKEIASDGNSEEIDFSNDDSDPDWTHNNKIKLPKSKKSCNDDDDIAVACSECNKIFCNSKALVRHKRNTHIPEEKKCSCNFCGRKFSSSCNMYKHMRTFHGPDSVSLIRKPSTKERIFQCEKCEKNYTKKSHLKIHIKGKHSNEENDSKKPSKCSNSSEIKTADNEGEKMDKPKKRYEIRSLCSICGSAFDSRSQLVVHMRRHTGERPFKCDLCERDYPRISDLVCHRRIHTGEKPFKCKICDKAFRVWSKMNNHMRSHSDIRPYKCKQCERSFKYSKDLNIHFRIHTGERPYKCNVCGSTFTQSNTLKAHRSKLGHMDDTNIV